MSGLPSGLFMPSLQWQSWLADHLDSSGIHARGFSSSFAEGLKPQLKPHADEPVQVLSLEVGVCIAILLMVVAIVFELGHLWYFRGEWSDTQIAARTDNAGAQQWNFKRNIQIALRYFRGDGRARGRILVCLIVLTGAVGVGVSYVVNVLVGRYWDALNAKDLDGFMQAVISFCCISAVGGILSTYVPYLKSMLHIHWRESLTQHYWRTWLAGSAYYRGRRAGVEVDNADQRIQHDTDSYVSETSGLFFGFINHTLTLAVFLPLLWSLSPPGPVAGVVWPGWLAQFALVYAIFGTWMVDYMGRPLIDYEYGSERSESDFRSRMAVIRDESEEVAMLRAEEAEQDRLQGLFGFVKSIYWQIIFLRKKIGLATGAFGLLGDIIPLLLLAPAYFDGTVSLGAMLQCRNAMRKVADCFQWGMHSYGGIAHWQCVSSRLYEVEKLAAAAGELPPLTQVGAFPGKLLAKKLGISRPPPGDPLIEDASFDASNKWTLITGPEGAGKTTLLRALKGLWPTHDGSEVECSDALFLPVSGKCAALRRGTLHAAVAYPQAAEAFTREQVVAALAAVDLGSFEPEDYAQCWSSRLSSGQFQRLQIAHVLCAQPQLLVLDEPTSHTAPGQAKLLYETLQTKCPSLKGVLTVTHQCDELKGSHDEHLVLNPETRSLGPTTL